MKYIVDIKGEIEGDYEIIGKYEGRPHGEWVFQKGLTARGSLKCSNCEWLDFRNGYFNYCPKCGAKMTNDTKQ